MLILDVSVLRPSIGRNAHCFRTVMRAFWRGAIQPQTLHGKRRREMGSRRFCKAIGTLTLPSADAITRFFGLNRLSGTFTLAWRTRRCCQNADGLPPTLKRPPRK